YTLYVMSTSPYSDKIRMYLKLKRLPVVEVRENLRNREQVLRARTGRTMVPVVITPADEALNDSTHITRRLEAACPSPAVRPADPGRCGLDALLEDYADEWVVRVMLACRRPAVHGPAEPGPPRPARTGQGGRPGPAARALARRRRAVGRRGRGRARGRRRAGGRGAGPARPPDRAHLPPLRGREREGARGGAQGTAHRRAGRRRAVPGGARRLQPEVPPGAARRAGGGGGGGGTARGRGGRPGDFRGARRARRASRAVPDARARVRWLASLLDDHGGRPACPAARRARRGALAFVRDR